MTDLNVTALTDRARLMVGGADAAAFLQNLLTQDIEACTASAWHHACLLTPQGKVLFEFLMRRSGAGFTIDCEALQAEALLKRFALYRLRAEVTLERVDVEGFVVWGGDAPSIADMFPDLRHRGLGVRGDATVDGLTTRPLADWHAHRIGLGIAEGSTEIESQTAFPLDYGLHLTGAIDFQKGCFIGQEVTSRVYRKGALRKQLMCVQGAKALPPIGTDIMAGARRAGVLRAVAGERGLALVRVDMMDQALQAGGIALTLGQVYLKRSLAKPIK